MAQTTFLARGALVLAVLGLLVGTHHSAAQAAPPDRVPGRLLVRFRPDVDEERKNGLEAAAGARKVAELDQIGVHVLQLPPNASEVAMARAFGQQAEVEFAGPDKVVPAATLTPNDPAYANWGHHLQQIACPTAWDYTTGDTGVIVAILDTGVDGTHPDLAGKLVPGWNFYNNNADTSDVSGHGTIVAGTAAAQSDNGIGVASVAWNCPIMPLRVSDVNGAATLSTIATALTWAADHGARVANISYSVSDSSTVASAAKYFQGKGGVATSAAGNEGTFDAASDNPYLLTVSAVDSSDVLYSWSNTGNNVDVAAPGWVYTTCKGGGYSSGAGTSVAAPLVAATAALVISANPGLTGAQAQDIIRKNADDLGPAGWDPQTGYGRINVARAVLAAMPGSATSSPAPAADTTPPAGQRSPAR